ncbi:protein ARK2N-like isoform X3 [Acipenser ruthenus]|uniref:protein ARK2N-like isoform X3 n=1 Tax=Acipenser ruthenus TaxID=7906 RepID=UPI00145A45C5|nr:protein ARK2N-like isoform X3 [Acipenser ruthenus]
MKMADAEKAEELVNSKTPPETPLEVAAGDETLKTETSPSEKGDSPLQTDPGLLSSMPCLLMELRRDSPESQQASTESEKQTPSRTYESDSSNHCMLSPSSSGHLADSDTLSSAEENGAPRAGASGAAEGGDSNSGAVGMVVAGGRKSRRSRSESEMSSTTSMAAKKNRWQVTGADKQNGRLAKVKGHRSQKHKERIRLLRQKREAAARKKYNLLQDSSTSDSDLTCDSSTSSSDDDKEVSGNGKTITGNIPGHINAEFATGDLSTCGPLQIKEEINIASSDSEVEIVGVQENTRCIHPRGGVIHSISSWKHGPISQYSSTRQSHLWTAVSPQPNWSSPPEVVDLTLDEDARRKYLL